MAKRFIILLSFLAYSLTFVHSLIPHHHHHDDTSQTHSHHHHDSADDNHHHDHEKKELSKFFSDVIHHPSAEQVIHPSQLQSENIQKGKDLDNFILPVIDQELFADFKPPNRNFSYHKVHYPLDLIGNSHLRAPPAI
jgi:hypothetical protein